MAFKVVLFCASAFLDLISSPSGSSGCKQTKTLVAWCKLVCTIRDGFCSHARISVLFLWLKKKGRAHCVSTIDSNIFILNEYFIIQFKRAPSKRIPREYYRFIRFKIKTYLFHFQGRLWIFDVYGINMILFQIFSMCLLLKPSDEIYVSMWTFWRHLFECLSLLSTVFYCQRKYSALNLPLGISQSGCLIMSRAHVQNMYLPRNEDLVYVVSKFFITKQNI